jgi:hypothetical protein
VTRLRERYSLQEAGWLLDQVLLQARAGDKFEHPERCLLLEEALQQASSLCLSRYHAQQFSEFRRIADLGCGIGGDLLGLTALIPTVTGVELDPIRAALARFNVINNGFTTGAEVVEGDWTRMRLDVEAAFIDPGRRVGGRRVFSLQEMIPPLPLILKLQNQIPNLAIKAAPGVDRSEIPPTAEVEFISEKGEMKEALLRFGALKQGHARRATLLPTGAQMTAPDHRDPPIAVQEAASYLYDPDPTILRAHLVKPLAAQIGAAMLDGEIAYLSSDRFVKTVFARVWQVKRQGPFHLKNLNRWLQETKAGEVVLKKRGSVIDTDEFQKRLKTIPGGKKVTVFFTQCKGKPWMILAEDV